MARPYSLELEYVIDEANDMAEEKGQQFCSLHLLFGLFVLDNSGGLLLTEEGWSEEALIPHIDRTVRESELIADEIMNIAEQASSTYRNREVNCLHLVVALCRQRNSMAYHTMQKAGVPISTLRNRALSLLVDEMPRRYSSMFDEYTRRKREITLAASKASGAATVNTPPKQVFIEAEPPKPSSRAAAPIHAPATRMGIPRYAGSLRILPEVAIDMLAEAGAGSIDRVIGREAELMELVDILNKRKANNPLVIGPPGVGKTALIEGLAWRMVHEPGSLPGFEGRFLFRLEPQRLLKGTHLRGSLSERMDLLQQDVAQAEGRIVLFLDDIHQIAEASADGSQEIGLALRESLARGDFPCIGATTEKAFTRSIEKDQALARRFHVMELEETDWNTTLDILKEAAKNFEAHHGVGFETEALEAAARLSDRYLRDRHQPDKSLGVLDMAGSRARRKGAGSVDERLVADVVSQLTAVPADQLVTDEARRYLNLETKLAERIIGHREVLKRIAETLRRNVAGFAGERPMGSFLFAGPTGVGKTEIARVLAEELFGDQGILLRFDMSEYSEPHSVAKLIGAPPGYVGHEDGGILTGAVRRQPFQILLFDEIEKAHPDVHQILLQLLDDGRLTDSLGRTADFTNTAVIMTSNMGGEIFDKSQRGIGFGGDDDADMLAEEVLKAVRRIFAPELYNRIDDKIVFKRLSESEIRGVAKLLLDRSAHRLEKEKGIRIEYRDTVPAALAEAGGFDPRYGARPMRRAIQRLIEVPLAGMILEGEVRRGDTVLVIPDDGGDFEFRKTGGEA